MAHPGPKKSTNVRLLRHALKAADRVAPALAAHVATRMWLTLPPGLPDTGLPAGGSPFELATQGSLLRGHTWGEGPAVYLVHGWGGRGGQLAGLVEPLVRRGRRPVLFDALSHGNSAPGPSGPRSANGAELARALDDVAARFGRDGAVVAHSMGAAATLLAMKYGSLSPDRLALLAPMNSYAAQFDAFERVVGTGPRTRRRVDRAVGSRVGLPVGEFDVRVLARQVRPVPTLVVHDRSDRQTAFEDSEALVRDLPDARLVATDGLGHHRLLRDAGVIEEVVSFVAGRPCGDRPAGDPGAGVLDAGVELLGGALDRIR